MKKGTLSLVVLLTTVFLSAQEAPSPAATQAIEVDAPEGAILSFRARGKTTVELVGTPRFRYASGEVEVENRTGYVEIKVGRGDIQGLPPASRWGSDYLTYVLWVVPVSGAAMNVGEVVLRDSRTEELKVSAPYQTFWFLVTAEPDFAVSQPSPMAVLVSRSQEETRTGNKALAVPGKLLYYTRYTDYDTTPAGAQSPGVPPDLRQARHAVALASRHQLLGPTLPAGRDLLADEQRARDRMEQARAYLAEAEAEVRREGESQEMTQLARTATQVAEDARTLATGAAAANRLAAEVGALRRSEADARQELTRAQRDLTSLGDRFSQLEAALDLERRRTRDLEGQLLALREQVSLLEGTVAGAQQDTARLREERSRLCDELRRQLASLGQLTEQGNQLALSLASDILFEFNRYNLQPAARENLAKLAVLRLLLFPEAPVRFEGHTDLVGDEDYNQWLSEQRALAVYRYFLEEQLAQSRIPDERAYLQERQEVVAKLLNMNYNTARRQASQRQEMLALLGGAVVGKGMSEPLVPEPGPNEQNRRVTLVFPEAAVRGLSALCPASPAGP
jgi:outer membrane protein OmpA-like peptidoglycan-associated protein